MAAVRLSQGVAAPAARPARHGSCRWWERSWPAVTRTQGRVTTGEHSVAGVFDQSQRSNIRLEGVWVGNILLQAKSRHQDPCTLARYANPGIEAVADLTADVDRERRH